MNSAIYAVAIVDDTDVEETECFELVLSGPTMGALEDCHITTTICIKDDDTTSKWSFYFKCRNEIERQNRSNLDTVKGSTLIKWLQNFLLF